MWIVVGWSNEKGFGPGANVFNTQSCVAEEWYKSTRDIKRACYGGCCVSPLKKSNNFDPSEVENKLSLHTCVGRFLPGQWPSEDLDVLKT